MAVLALLLTPGVGNVSVAKAKNLAINSGKPLEELINLSQHDFEMLLPVGADSLVSIFKECNQELIERAQQVLEHVVKANIEVITTEDKAYPEELNQLLDQNAPPLLFAIGNRELLKTKMVAVVGAREVTDTGAAIADECATVYADNGATIVSGGADGVDSVAHQAALQSGADTIVILPQGLLTYDPPDIIKEAIQNGKALLLSAFSPYASWQRHAAVTRNAYISALSELICVIEPQKTGGSIRTARCAIEQGKRVLFYCATNNRDAANILTNAGALNLIPEKDRIDPDYLLEMWKTSPEKQGGQEMLF